MAIEPQIQVVDRYNPATLAENPDALFWQQSPPRGADLNSAETFAHRLLAKVAERRQVYALRRAIEKQGRRLGFTERRLLQPTFTASQD